MKDSLVPLGQRMNGHLNVLVPDSLPLMDNLRDQVDTGHGCLVASEVVELDQQKGHKESHIGRDLSLLLGHLGHLVYNG